MNKCDLRKRTGIVTDTYAILSKKYAVSIVEILLKMSTELECLDEEAECLFCTLAAVSDDFKNALLQCRVVDTHRT